MAVAIPIVAIAGVVARRPREQNSHSPVKRSPVRSQNFSGRPIACHPSSRPGNQGSVGIASRGCQRLPLPSRPWTTWTRFSGSCSRGLIRTRPVFRSRCICPGGRVSGYAAEPSEFRSDNADRISERWEGYVSLLRAHETNQSVTIGVCTRCAIHGRASENARAPNCQV
jgi:hypothetical protein